ncbi:MAG: TonB-dependent receptor [Cyclobacteriaceae bacterium]|nr:TonB-dependent receptor [Cyclobacteriaceae bacterium]
MAVGIAVALLATFTSFAQTTQTVRGRVLDEVSQSPLIGVNVMLMGTEKITGSASDVNGYFRIENVPLGRQSFKISYIGYEEQFIPNVIVTAGKEVILNITLTESVRQLNDLVIVADSREDKTATVNDLAVVSARSFNVDDTKRYAGALGDPSRMAANFAGVVGGDDSRNDIVVRGNSPSGMLWQLEGLNIPNPNHFGSLTSTGGPVSMLNNNNLDKSDFITSAFPSQYGNATAGVFDIRLRDGNNQQHEYVGQIGFNGFEVGAEGPLSKKNNGSFIANYRYSTLGIFQSLGIEFGTGSNTPLYQDLNFKVSLPTKGNGKWTLFGLGGISAIDLLGSEADLSTNTDLYGSENQDTYPRYKTGIAGLSYEKNINSRTFLKLTGGVSYTYEEFTGDSLVRNMEDEVIAKYNRYEAEFTTRKYSVVGSVRTKFNSKNSMTSGFYMDHTDFDLFNRDIYANLARDSVRIDVHDNTTLYQAYTTWKHRFNTKFLMNLGVHAQYYSLNEQLALEPRLGFQYLISGNHSLSLGFGLHNQIQSIYTSFVQTKLPTEEVVLTNTQLDFTQSQHSVLTYDWNINEHFRLKAEAYYQQLRNVPVEQMSSTFSALNTGASFIPSDTDSLVSKGMGKNYGMELTLERFFHKGYYFLMTGSLFDSRYEGSDGIERNTAYNTQYVFNALGGKEWRVGKKKNYLVLNLKLTTIGGKYLTPINVEASQALGRTIYDEANAFSEKQDPYFRMDVKLSYRKEYSKSTLEFALDLQNVTNNQNIFSQSYNPRTNTVVTQYQQGFFPVPFVRFTF